MTVKEFLSQFFLSAFGFFTIGSALFIKPTPIVSARIILFTLGSMLVMTTIFMVINGIITNLLPKPPKEESKTPKN
jgi:hypothetical protein